MKSEYAHERRQSAERMEAVMQIVSVMGAAAAVLALFTDGWLPSIILVILSAITFGLSRVFDLLADLLSSAGEENKKLISRSEKGDKTGS